MQKKKSKVSKMNTESILKALKFRLESLESAYKCLSKPEHKIALRILDDYETRMDEVEGFIYYIEGRGSN